MSFDEPTIALKISGIACEILSRTELSWVDEEAHDQIIRVLFAQIHQARVALVQVSHGGDKANTSACVASGCDALTSLGDPTGDAQRGAGSSHNSRSSEQRGPDANVLFDLAFILVDCRERVGDPQRELPREESAKRASTQVQFEPNLHPEICGVSKIHLI